MKLLGRVILVLRLSKPAEIGHPDAICFLQAVRWGQPNETILAWVFRTGTDVSVAQGNMES